MAKISIDLNSGSVKKGNDLVVGIDLGTTNSLVAIMDQETGKPITLSGEKGHSVITPSIVHFNEDGSFDVGEEARAELVRNSQHTVYSVKRLMGKSYGDVSKFESYFGYKVIDEDTESLVKIKLGDRFFSPIELSAQILKELKTKAEKELGQKVAKAVITVPAYFNDSQRQATRDAGKLAGLEVLRIVNEPTAASLAYGIGLDKGQSRTVAVYDLGGGTFDISILRIEDGVFEVLSTNGNTFLGGDDFDRSIVNYWMGIHNGVENLSSEEMQSLRLTAEEAKKTVCGGKSFTVEFKGEEIKLDRQTFDNLINTFVEETIACCRDAVRDSGIDLKEIDEVVMVGGSTRVPYVLEQVSALFEHSKVDNSLNPDEIVALGAAIEADILAGNRKDLLLLDVTPLSLGIETLGGLMDVIIPRNTRVPFRAGRNYTTSVDGQVNLKISVFQGERDQVKENRKLAEFVLSNIPAMPAGLPKIEIAFMLDADGILKVRAKELRSGVEQTIDVKPQYGLTDEEVEAMLKDSLVNAESDMEYRAVKEAINESEYLITSTHKFVEQNSHVLEPDVKEQITELIDELIDAIKTEDKDRIQGKQDALNEFTKPYAEKALDSNIAKALRGKNIE